MNTTLSRQFSDSPEHEAPELPGYLQDVPLLLTTGDASHVLLVSPVWVKELVERGEIKPAARSEKRQADGRIRHTLYLTPEDVLELKRRRDGVVSGQLELPLLRPVGRAR